MRDPRAFLSLLALCAAVAADSVPIVDRASPEPAVLPVRVATDKRVPRVALDRSDLGRRPQSRGAGMRSDIGFTRFGFYDPATGAAVPGSTWTFDHGAADPFEGWKSQDARVNLFTAFRHVDTTTWYAHNDTTFGPPQPPPPILGGSGSVWLGYFEDEATCLLWANERGYGNSWWQRLYSPAFTNASGFAVTVSFDYFVDMETDFDFLNVTVMDADFGNLIQTWTLTGQSGSPGSPTPFSQPVATGVGTFRLLFDFSSDGFYSDEDGNYTTVVGAVGIDNVTLTNVSPAGPWTFESDLDGWTAEPVTSWYPPFASIVPNNFEIPDTACELVSNVVAFYDPSDTTHPGGQQEIFTSPAVPLDAFPDTCNVFVQMDMYPELPAFEEVFFKWAFSYVSCGGVWSSPIGPALLYYDPSTNCSTRRFYATDRIGGSPWVPPGVDSVRFHFTVVQNSGPGPGTGNFSPLVDNIWIGVSAAANVIHVPSPSYPTIQSGIDAAAPGDTVLVAAGIYSGPGNCSIDFGGKDIVLVSEDGPLVTVLDCLESSRNLHFQSGETAAAVVDGFTFTGGDSTIGGCSIRIGPTASSPTIRNCAVKGNVAQYPDSAIVRIEAGSPSFTGCTFLANRGNPEVVLVTGGTPSFTDCFIIQNVGTGLVADPVAGTWADCTFSSNTSGGVHLRGSVPGPAPGRSDSCLVQPTFTGCAISGNTTTASGGGILIDPVVFCVYTPLFESCLITGNSASGNGGGLALLGTVWDGATAPHFAACTFAGNTAGIFGGALYVGAYDAAGLGQGFVSVEGSIVWDNCSDDLGALALVEDGNELSVSCSLADTSAGVLGDGVITMSGVSALAPGFCRSVRCGDSPTSTGDFHLSMDSPALPGVPGNPCGVLMGALDTGCSAATGASVVAPLPSLRTMLHPCEPNPTRGTTSIRYALSRAGPVSVRIYDVTGRRVATIEEGFRDAAEHRVEWDGRNGAGHVMAAGVYFVRLVTEDHTETRRIVLLR